jgi:hypothetical protein
MKGRRSNQTTRSRVTNDHTTNREQTTPGRYEIRFRGELDDRWTAWFDGLTASVPGDGTTVVAGQFPDQAAIHGVLERVRDLGLTLISVTPVPAAATPNHPSQSNEEEKTS